MRCRLLPWIGLVVLLVSSNTLWAQETRLGMILKAQGHVTVPRFVESSRKPIEVHAGFPLRSGDVVTVKAGGSCECVLWNGGAGASRRYILSAGSSARVEPGRLVALSGKPPQKLAGGYNPAAWQRRGTDFLAGMDRASDSTRPGPYDLQPHGLVPRSPIVLRWKFRSDSDDPNAPGRKIRLDIQQVDNPANHLTVRLPLQATQFTVPQKAVDRENERKFAQKPGVWYQATAGVESERYGMTTGFFRLSSEEDKIRLEALRKTLSILPADDVDGRLACAEEMAGRGDFASAATIYDELLKQFPNDADIQSRRKRLTTYLSNP